MTDQTDNFFTIAHALGLASETADQQALSSDAKVAVKNENGKFVADLTGFNGDAVVSYELKDQSGKVLDASNSSTPVSGVRVATGETTAIALDKVAEGGSYTLTVTGRQSGKTVPLDFQGPAQGSGDKTPDGVVAEGQVQQERGHRQNRYRCAWCSDDGDCSDCRWSDHQVRSRTSLSLESSQRAAVNSLLVCCRELAAFRTSMRSAAILLCRLQFSVMIGCTCCIDDTFSMGAESIVTHTR